MRSTTTFFLTVASALVFQGCGGSSAKPSTTATVTASIGATLTAGVATLTVPPGALSHDTTVTLREAEPHHAGGAVRVEVEPHDALVAGHQALLAVRVGDQNVRVKFHDGADDSLADVEVDDRNHDAFKTALGTLHDVEVELEHGTACSSACAAGQECDDGLCQGHDHAATACSAVCAMGHECDHGACETHVQYETDHGGTPGMCMPTCASGLACHDGTCSAHE